LKSGFKLFNQGVGLGKLKVIIANSASIFLVLFREDINFPKESCNSSFFWWDLSFKALILSKKV
jgi:hypothetical protein